MGFFIFVSLALSIMMIAAQWMMVEKAGYPGISQLIPIWNVYVLVKMAGYSGWAMLLYMIPFVNIIFGIMVWYKIVVAFGHDGVFVIVVLFLPIVGIPILGFGDNNYDGPGYY